jgi:hypothetical protein
LPSSGVPLPPQSNPISLSLSLSRSDGKRRKERNEKQKKEEMGRRGDQRGMKNARDEHQGNEEK